MPYRNTEVYEEPVYNDAESVYDDNDYSSVSSWEEEDDQVCYKVRWPATRMAYPSAAFLAKHCAPVFTSPKPAEPAFVEKYTAVMEMLKGLNEKKDEIKAKQTAKSGELLKAEATPISYGSKWSDKAKGNGREALIKRLSEEMAALQKEYESVTGQIHKTEETNKAVINYIKAVENTKALFEKGKKDDKEAWIRIYGPHTPIKSLEQLVRYYRVSVSPSPDAGMIRIHFPDDMEVGQAVRELKMGGHEYVWRVHWDCIEVMESGFKE